jgi:hypothetical protein
VFCLVLLEAKKGQFVHHLITPLTLQHDLVETPLVGKNAHIYSW